MKKRVYISIPTSGEIWTRRQRAIDVVRRYVNAGYDFFIPSRIIPYPSGNYAKDIVELSKCDLVALIDDWNSDMACIRESFIATTCGIETRIVRI